MTKDQILDLIAAHVTIEQECWIWTGPTQYRLPRVLIDDVAYPAHRLAYELRIKPIPAGHIVAMSCDQGLCINPEHMLIRPMPNPKKSN